MPYVHHWHPRMVIKTFSGHVSGEEFVASAEDVAASPRFDALRFIVNDFREARSHSVNEKSMQMIAAIRMAAMDTHADIKVLVVSRDEQFKEFAGLAAKPPLAGTQETLAFDTMEQAIEWIERQEAAGSHP